MVEREARMTLEKILEKLKKNQEHIGKELANSVKTTTIIKRKKRAGKRR